MPFISNPRRELLLLALFLPLACASHPPVEQPRETIRYDGSYSAAVDVPDTLPCPEIDVFVPMEVMPEMVHREEPNYPIYAERTIARTVWIRSLVGYRGNVIEARIYRSSGEPPFDQAALDAAVRCRFKPAIQNGRPICSWVVYKVKFDPK